VRATVTAYRRFAIDRPRRYRLMFSLEYEPDRPPTTGHPVGTALQAWTDTADAYLSEVVPGRRAEAQDLGVHLWTALHGQLILFILRPTLPSSAVGNEAILIELLESLLPRLLPAPEAASPAE
jgi:hypothetical protein